MNRVFRITKEERVFVYEPIEALTAKRVFDIEPRIGVVDVKRIGMQRAYRGFYKGVSYRGAPARVEDTEWVS